MDRGPATTRVSDRSQLGCGTRVEVRNRFVSSWSDGFEVARVLGDGYRVRRVSDHVELPATVPPDAVRPKGALRG